MQKKQKIKPENEKLKNLKTVLVVYLTFTGSPAFNFKCCFLCFLFKGAERRG
jgi:hypothetical protein